MSVFLSNTNEGLKLLRNSRWDEFSNHSPVTIKKESEAYRGSLEGVHDIVHDIIVSNSNILCWKCSHRLNCKGGLGHMVSIQPYSENGLN